MSSAKSIPAIASSIVAFLACVFAGLLATDWYGQAARGSTDQATLANLAVAASIASFLVAVLLLRSGLRARRPT